MTVRSLGAFLLTGLLALAAATAGPGAGSVPGTGGAAAPPRVTLIGDSIATGIAYNADAKKVLSAGIDLRLELAVCRRVDGVSCPYNGVTPPNVVNLVGAIGAGLGRVVIVAVGYNDYESQYERNIETALAALRKAGVERVLWSTLRAERQSYIRMNATIAAVAARHREMSVIEWNVYSRSHPDWFQQDGLHLTHDGAVAMATLFHTALEKLGLPVEPPPPAPAPPRLRIVTRALPAAVSGRRYSVKLRAGGGRGPYRWSRAAAFPKWLALSPSGRLSGTVRAKRGTVVTVKVRVTDSTKASASRRLSFRVKGP